MAHSAQARKRIRQNANRRLRNKSVQSEIKTLTKRFAALVEARDKEGAATLFRALVSKMDKAARRRIYHRNTIARKKSSAARLLASVG
jgi:small subunit ribosomal protein S20